MDIEAWLARLSAELDVADIQPDDNDLRTLLDLARDAAHQVGERPAAPLTTFLVGVAVGRGQDLGEAAARATALALGLDDPVPQSRPSTDGDTDQST
jgi:hypothetical protein